MSDGALSDLKVLEYADFVSGPFCAKLMADLGAEVIKIEAPSSGDTARQTGPFPEDVPHPERSGLFLYLNTNKRSVTLDPSTPTGAAIFKELVKTADVLIENRPPSTMERLGLGYESLRQINPGLIMTSVTPFGQFGPYSHYKANDLICCQMSGLAFHTPTGGVASDEIPPLKPGGRQSDFVAGSTAATATMFAIIARQTLGEGQHVDVSQQESIASFLRHQVPYYTYDPEGLPYLTLYDNSARIRRPIVCQDGFIMIACTENAQWRALLELIAGDNWERNEELRDAVEGEYRPSEFIQKRKETIDPILRNWAAKLTMEEAVSAVGNRDIPIGALGGSFGFGYLPCQDGYIVSGCREDYQWRALVEMTVGSEWQEDERFKDIGDFDFTTIYSWGGVVGSLAVEWTIEHTREEVTKAAQSRGIPIVPCNSTEDLFRSPHFAERQFLVEINHPQTGKLSYPGAPYHLSETPWRVNRPAPLLGQHNEEILCERLGYSKEELASMRESGIV